MTDYVSTPIRQTAKGPRIWLQGEILTRNGFTKGVNYTRKEDKETGTITLSVNEHGSKVVSGKIRNKVVSPLIDIVNNAITEVAQGASELSIEMREGEIILSVPHLRSKQAQRESAFRQHTQEGQLTEGTFCVGIGMATLGLKQGFAKHGITMSSKWIVDREARYLDVALRNNPAVTSDTQVFNMPLESLDVSKLSQVDIAQFSLPCTLHCKSGKSKNKLALAEQHSTDATAMYGLMKSFETVNAAIYVSENVTEAQDSATYILIKSTLQVLGYDIYETILNNEQSGSFENRNRYWFVAVSSGLDINKDILVPTYPRQYERFAELMDAVADNDEAWSDNTYLKEKAIRDAAAGKGFAKRQLINEDTTQVGVINRHYTKRQSTPPMVIRAIDDKERLVTVNEHARVKSCDPMLVANTPMTTAHEGLGQGVDMNQAIGLAEFIAMAICLNTTPAQMYEAANSDAFLQVDFLDALFG